MNRKTKNLLLIFTISIIYFYILDGHNSFTNKNGISIMPYHQNADLPAGVRDHLPARAQTIFRKAFNHAYHEYPHEETVFKIAWSAVKKGYKKKGDSWVKKTTKKPTTKKAATKKKAKATTKK